MVKALMTMKNKTENIIHIADSMHYDRTFCGILEIDSYGNNKFVYFENVEEIDDYKVPDELFTCKKCAAIAMAKVIKGEEKLHKIEFKEEEEDY